MKSLWQVRKDWEDFGRDEYMNSPVKRKMLTFIDEIPNCNKTIEEYIFKISKIKLT